LITKNSDRKGIILVITKDMLIGDVLRKKPEATKILAEFGMGCLGCPSSQMESIEDAAKVHGLEVEKILKSLNKD